MPHTPQEVSGKKGKVKIGSSDLSNVRNWRFAQAGNNQQYSSSGSPGHKKSVDGVKSGTVSGEIVNDTQEPIWERLKVGDLVTFLLYEDRDATSHWIVPCRIDDLEPSADIENGTPEATTFSAQTQGAWTYPDGTLSV